MSIDITFILRSYPFGYTQGLSKYIHWLTTDLKPLFLIWLATLSKHKTRLMNVCAEIHDRMRLNV